ncbi:hypothetical protein H1R20_g4848, partial [Candolleomyces eurysporus]
MSGLNTVFGASEPASVIRTIIIQPRECDRLLQYLVDPEIPSRVRYNYVAALKAHFLNHNASMNEKRSRRGHDAFEKIAVKAGIAKTLFQIARDDSKVMEHVFTSCFAAEALWELIQTGTDAQRKELMEQYVNEHSVIDFCLQAISGAFFIAHRLTAMKGLRVMAQQCRLADFLSVEKTSQVIKAMCKCILMGPDLWVRQLKDPSMTWQSLFCFGKLGASTTKARKYAPREYAMFQENAAWVILETVLLHPVPEQEHYNQIIEQDPEILDLLLDCANTRRDPPYAELQVDSRVAESLALMLNFPADMVPGVKVELVEGEQIQNRLGSRWEALMNGVKILTSRPEWCRKINRIWKRIEGEDIDKIAEWIENAEQDYYATLPPDEDEIMEVVSYRDRHQGHNGSAVSDVDLLNLLPITRAACQEVKDDDDIEDEDFKALAELEERDSDTIYRSGSRDPTRDDDDEGEVILQINEEVLTGPICHIRILVSVAKRGIFEKVQQWNKAPKGLDVGGGGLRDVKKMLSDEEIERSLDLCLKRMAKGREDGNELFREHKGLDEAQFKYWGTAQLAAAVVEFDEVTNGRYHAHARGARKELVLNLGNAAEMALGREYWERALVFASAAAKLAEEKKGGSSEEVGEAVLEKNKRRVERARFRARTKRI